MLNNLNDNDETKSEEAKNHINSTLKFFFILSFFLVGCNNDYSPKPRGFFRIELPKKNYISFKPAECPFTFEIPEYSVAIKDTELLAEPCWYNVIFPSLQAQINLSYKKIDNNLNTYLEDSRTLAYRHTVKADAINENILIDEKRKVYGMLYDLKGNTASAIQFYITDSTKHFLRGSLYFNVVPQRDSLQPVIRFLEGDIYHLLETIKWKI